jgi:hypothetical protein
MVEVIRGALLSANANNGTNAGFGYLNTNNRSSNANANIGFRLYRGISLETKIYCDRFYLTTQGLSVRW